METRKVTLSKHQFGDDTDLETIKMWQEAGMEAIWRAIDELTALGYALQGQDLGERRIDRTKLEKRRVPWLSNDPGADA